MSKKPRVIAVASKLRKKFKDNTPTELYSIWGKNDAIKEILTSFTPNDVAILYFLVTTPIEDLSIAYDVISINMYGVQLISINETDPTIDCEDCEGRGYISCDECYGQGYIDCDYCKGGDIECGDCGGDGKDEEGDECGACEGRGEIRCEQCDGDGSNRCQNCSDGDVECSYCDGRGEVTASGKIEYEMKNFLTYNPNLMNQFQDIDEYTKISNELYETMSLDKYNLLITIENHITDAVEFDDYNDGDCFITQIISPQALALKKGHRTTSLYTNSFGII